MWFGFASFEFFVRVSKSEKYSRKILLTDREINTFLTIILVDAREKNEGKNTCMCVYICMYAVSNTTLKMLLDSRVVKIGICSYLVYCDNETVFCYCDQNVKNLQSEWLNQC